MGEGASRALSTGEIRGEGGVDGGCSARSKYVGGVRDGGASRAVNTWVWAGWGVATVWLRVPTLSKPEEVKCD